MRVLRIGIVAMLLMLAICWAQPGQAQESVRVQRQGHLIRARAHRRKAHRATRHHAHRAHRGHA